MVMLTLNISAVVSCEAGRYVPSNMVERNDGWFMRHARERVLSMGMGLLLTTYLNAY